MRLIIFIQHKHFHKHLLLQKCVQNVEDKEKSPANVRFAGDTNNKDKQMKKKSMRYLGLSELR